MTCLRYVSEHFGARGLGEPLRTLSRNPVTPREVRRFLFFTSPPRRRTLINRVRKQWMLYNSVAHEASGLAKVSRFPLFLLHKSGCAGLFDGLPQAPAQPFSPSAVLKRPQRFQPSTSYFFSLR